MEAPFYIGQKVVCIDGSDWNKHDTHNIFSNVLKEGNVYVVKGQRECICGMWMVTVGFNNVADGCICKCGTAFETATMYHGHFRFAPMGLVL